MHSSQMCNTKATTKQKVKDTLLCAKNIVSAYKLKEFGRMESSKIIDLYSIK